MKAKLCAVAAVAGFFAMPVAADQSGDTYVGVQYSHLTYDESEIDDLNPAAIGGRLGHYFHDNFSLEGRFGVGLNDDSTSVEMRGVNVDLDFEVDYLFGVYGVGHLPINDWVSLYALAGFAQAKVSVTASAMGSSFSESADGNGFSYGAGGQINLTPDVALTVEYASYYSDDDVDVTGVSAGLNYKF